MGAKKISISLLILLLVAFIFLVGILVWRQINSQFDKVNQGRVPEINQSVNYTPWVSETANTYPFDAKSKSGAVRDTNYGNRISLLGTIVSITETSILIKMNQTQLELNLGPEVSYFSFDESRGIGGLAPISIQEIKPGDRVVIALQDDSVSPFVFQIQKLVNL